MNIKIKKFISNKNISPNIQGFLQILASLCYFYYILSIFLNFHLLISTKFETYLGTIRIIFVFVFIFVVILKTNDIRIRIRLILKNEYYSYSYSFDFEKRILFVFVFGWFWKTNIIRIRIRSKIIIRLITGVRSSRSVDRAFRYLDI